MLETAIALAFGHFVGDFLLQTDAMIRDKARTAVLLRHVGVVALASWAALGFAPAPLLLLLIAASHFAIDRAKLLYGSPSFAPFACSALPCFTILSTAPSAFLRSSSSLPAGVAARAALVLRLVVRAAIFSPEK